ncbi:MAG: family 43 glycosylhydrolase, partial [Candidatus Latescibacteria bacterium]|nr:family 43 glycosylhydrolase [Candidatus Latescibacterota bacterium]
MNTTEPYEEPVQGMHGVIREYASLAPTATATPLAPILDEPLTDISIARSSDGMFYMVGSTAGKTSSTFSRKIRIWQSTDLDNWKKIRTVNLDRAARSPEIHFLQDACYLTLEIENQGTELLRFKKPDLISSTFTQTQITQEGKTPSIFLDDDGTFYWVMNGGDIARMADDPMNGLAETPKCLLDPEDNSARKSNRRRGAFLTKIDGFYHLFVADRKLRHDDIGRTGLIGGTDDTFVAATRTLDEGFSKQYLGFPCAGQTTLFRDHEGALWATYSCTDTRGTFQFRPGVFKVEKVRATEPTWSTGFNFAGRDVPELYAPQGFFLRPDTSFIYEQGVGTLKPIPMERAPCRYTNFPWIRDTSIILGHD